MFGTLLSENIFFLITKIIKFRGDLTDISAEVATLAANQTHSTLFHAALRKVNTMYEDVTRHFSIGLCITCI